MKGKLLKLHGPGAIFFIAVLTVFFLLNLSNCGTGYIFKALDELNEGTYTPDETDPTDDGVPTEIIPEGGGDGIADGGGTQDDGGTLVDGDDTSPDDGWDPPDPGTDPDQDNDGFPDDEDNFDDRVFYLCVASYDASSAEVTLNGDVIFGTNAFDNTDWIRCRVINPLQGTNNVSSGYTITGKPYTDRIEIAVKEFNPDTGTFIKPDLFYADIQRTTGTPQDFDASFTID